MFRLIPTGRKRNEFYLMDRSEPFSTTDPVERVRLCPVIG
jgi:hypothetical protein